MTKVLNVFVFLACLYPLSGLAAIYRWTDDAGRVHYTDNPGTIPPDRQPQRLKLSPPPANPPTETPGTTVPQQPTTVAPAPDTGPSRASSETVNGLQQRQRELMQQIDKTRQERDAYVEQLNSVREVRTNPAFGGRTRRQADELGRSLAAAEQQLDTLQSELRKVEAQLQALKQDARPTPMPAGDVQFDDQGHDRVYWQRRFASVRHRLDQAQTQRQKILEQLALDPNQRQTFGRRGREVLQLTQELQRVEQEIRDAEAALRGLRQEASKAGAPTAWVQ